VKQDLARLLGFGDHTTTMRMREAQRVTGRSAGKLTRSRPKVARRNTAAARSDPRRRLAGCGVPSVESLRNAGSAMAIWVRVEGGTTPTAAAVKAMDAVGAPPAFHFSFF
jgi:hypothetical protein